jgi:hypothetical protein
MVKLVEVWHWPSLVGSSNTHSDPSVHAGGLTKTPTLASRLVAARLPPSAEPGRRIGDVPVGADTQVPPSRLLVENHVRLNPIAGALAGITEPGTGTGT